MSLFISEAVAATTSGAPAQAASPFSSLILIVGMLVVFYFLLIRPQSKRAKEHRELVSNLAKGDEVGTHGGLLGKVSKISDNYIVLQIAENVEINCRKDAVSQVLVKGTLKSI